MFKSLFLSLVNLLFLQLCLSIVSALSPTQDCIDGRKLCFGSPSNCPTSSDFNCDLLVQISAKENVSNGLDVDIYGKGSPGTYFALGFVNKIGMSGATVVHCDYREDSSVMVNEGYTDGYKLIGLPSGTLTEARSGRIENGLVHCSWVQRSNGYAGASSIYYDIQRNYYVQIATGPITDGSPRRHKIRSITEAYVNLTSVGVISSGKTIALPIRVHGSLMTLAWLGFVSVAMVIARYHKNSWGTAKMCNVNIWFALHRGLMLAALSSAIIGMISIFVHVGGWRADTPHQYFGLFANILMILQPLGALLRSAPDHEKRIYFNVGHTIGGNLGHILAILALFFVAKLSITLSKTYYIMLCVFIGVYLTTHLILQFHPHLLSTLNIIETTDMSDLKGEPTSNSSQSHPVRETLERSKKRVLTLFIALVIIIAISLIAFINLGSP